MMVAHRLFPAPIAVFQEIWFLATERYLFADLGETLRRAAIAFVAAMTIGVAIGGALGRFRVSFKQAHGFELELAHG